MKSLQRILAIVRKEIRQLRRDRLTFGMIVGIPVLQLLMFGYAINTDVRNLRTAIANQANTHLSREFVAERVPSTCYTELLDCLQRHRDAGHREWQLDRPAI